MHHKVFGSQHAETVVLIHGLTGDLRTYDTVARSLSQYYRVVTVDLRGHGETPAYGWNYSSALLAKDIKALLNELNGRWSPAADRVHIVGHSFGGKVALRFTELFPESVRSLVIEDMQFIPATAAQHDELVERGWGQAVAKVRAKLPRAGLALDPASSGPSQTDVWQGLPDKEFVVPLFGSQVRGEDFENALAQLRVPALFLRPARGENGAMTDRGVRHVRGRVRHAQIVEFEGAGHDIHNARTDDYLRVVGTFLADSLPR
jgi:esterase